MPKVSIIVPMYNSAKFLDRCVQSLVNQTLKDIEIILVNDASPDNSLELAKAYEEQDARIKVIDLKENIVASRNPGIKIAKGAYLGFVDADDWVEPEMYERLYNATDNETIDVVVCNIQDCYPNGDRIKEHILSPDSFISAETVKQSVTVNGGRLFTNIWKKNLLTEDVYFKEHNLYNDTIVFLWYLKAKTFIYIDYIGYNYYLNTESITQIKNNPGLWHRTVSAIDMVERSKVIGLYEVYKEEIDAKFYQLYLRNTLLQVCARYNYIPVVKLKEIRVYFLNNTDIYNNKYYAQQKTTLDVIVSDIFLKHFGLGIFVMRILMFAKCCKDYIYSLRNKKKQKQ